MTSRVTQGMMSIQLLRNLNSNMLRMDTMQNQLSTGRKINKPSDDPVGISFSMRYRSEYSANEQYRANVDAAISWMSYTDKMMEQTGSVLHRVRELTVGAANGSNPDDALQTVRIEIEQLKEQLLNIANSQFNGKYVFNGQMTDKPPYSTADPVSELADIGEIKFEVGAGVKMAVNINGNQIFGTDENEDNMFRLMDDLMLALDESNFSAISSMLGKIDSRMEVVLEVRADVGAKMNRLELAEDRLLDIGINLQALTTKTEDADMAIVITNLKMAENVYQASLSAGSRLIMPSLMDFLR